MKMDELLALVIGERPDIKAQIVKCGRPPRATIKAAVAPEEQCFLCDESLFSGKSFYNAEFKVDGSRGWICESCRLNHALDYGLVVEPGHTFPSNEKMIVLLHEEGCNGHPCTCKPTAS